MPSRCGDRTTYPTSRSVRAGIMLLRSHTHVPRWRQMRSVESSFAAANLIATDPRYRKNAFVAFPKSTHVLKRVGLVVGPLQPSRVAVAGRRGQYFWPAQFGLRWQGEHVLVRVHRHRFLP